MTDQQTETFPAASANGAPTADVEDRFRAQESVTIRPLQDGFTIQSEVQQVEGLSPRIRFKYRPAGGWRRKQYRSLDGREQYDDGLKLICEHVSDVRVQAPDGRWLPFATRLTEKLADGLHDVAMNTFIQHVMGVVGPVRIDDDEGKG
jgi:hypothetical protein